MTDSEPTTNTTHVPMSQEEEQAQPQPQPRPRLCHLRKWPHFQGYGFNLHAERAKTGQHIGKVDPNSPAESAGLKEGDRIVEVNFVNISNENHQQVVKRIRNGVDKNGKFVSDEVVLLVLDQEADVYYRSLNIIVKSDFKNILKFTTPEKPNDDENNNEDAFLDQHIANTNESSSQQKLMLSDATNTVNDMTMPAVLSTSKNQLKDHSMSSISQKSGNSIGAESSTNDGSSSANQANSAVVVNNNNENLLNPSASSMAKSSNKDAVSSTSNLSVSSNNQSNSSKATTPNIQTKNESNTYLSSTNDSNKMANTNLSHIYDQNSIDRRQNANSNNQKVDPFQNLDDLVLFRADSFCSQISSTGSRLTVSTKPDRPPPPKPTRTFSQTSADHYYLKLENGKINPYHTKKSRSDTAKLDKYLEMSAAEFKTYLKSKGRADPRVTQVDMRQKFQMFQDM